MTKFAYKTASALALPAAVLLAAGCSSSKSGSVTTTPPAGSTTSSASTGTSQAAGAGTAVTATESEFSIALSTNTFKAGAYTFTVKNDGKFPHNLTVEGPGVDKTSSPTLPGGSTGQLTVTLQKGSYELWCSVDGHKGKGMEMTVQVS